MGSLRALSVGLLLLFPALGSSQARVVVPQAQDGVTGLWRGIYHYPEGSGMDSVTFHVTLIQDGATVVGFVKEPNTFGKRQEPWLHATLRGRYDARTGKLTFTKTYDGTAGEDHDVEYAGQRDGTRVQGNWNIEEFGGRFTLQKLRLDDQTLDNVRKGPGAN